MNEVATETEPIPPAVREDGIGCWGKWLAGISEARIRKLGSLLGGLIYRVDVPHRRIVRRNLGFAFPDWPPEKVRRCSLRIFENIGTALLEILQLRYLEPEEILRRARIEGLENVAASLASGRGIVIISAHLGNWELAPLFFALAFGRPMVLVARKVRPPSLDRWVMGMRTRFGNRVIDKQGGLGQMMRNLRQGSPLGLLIDQGTRRSEGVKVTFFDRTVSATPAAAMLALRCRSPVYAAFSIRHPEGGFVLKVFPELEMQRTKDLRADLKINTEKMLAVIEKMVRAYPEQWFWVNKRWKHYHPELYPEYQARRWRRKRRKSKHRSANGG